MMEINYNNKKYRLGVQYKGGKKELIIFLHGLGATKDTYRHMWDYVQFEKFSLLTLDFIGFGESSKPNNFTYSMADQAKIIAKLLTQFTEEKIHIVMHSMGGAIGILLAELLDHKLGKIINCEGNLIAEDCGIVSRKSISVTYPEFENTLLPQFVASFGGQIAQASPIAFYQSATSLVSWSDSNKLLNKFANLKTNKAYFYGDKSEQWQKGQAILTKKFIDDKIPLIGISNASHGLMEDNPEEFYNRLYNFFTFSSR